MPWQYSAQIWTSPDGEAWHCDTGTLVYLDSEIAHVKTSDGRVLIGPLHCVYIQTPLPWFVKALQEHPIGTGRYGGDGPFKRTVARVERVGLSTSRQRKNEVSDEEDIFG